jgi:hypothetical protein
VKVSTVEVKDVELPQGMQRAMARQAEAERERRAKVINAEGELQASQQLAEAGRVLAAEPATLQLRFLQTLSEVATEKNSTIVFPVPIDLIRMFAQGSAVLGDGGDGGAPRPRVHVGGRPAGEPPPAAPPTHEGTVS